MPLIQSTSDLIPVSDIPEININNYTGNLQSNKKSDSSMKESSSRPNPNQYQTCAEMIFK